jgi:hypothetical protein
MNTPRNEPEDEVTGAYRRTSEAEAGRPATATRAAILAEARAANLRRTPAANESSYAWRAVAGLAVIGVAVLLWRQADRHVSPDLTVASVDRSDAAAEAPILPQIAADTPVVADEPAAKVEMEEARAPASRERESKRAEETRTEATAATDTASVAAPAAPSLERASADAAPALAAGARQDASDHQALLQREFPEIWRGETTASTVWAEIDAAGKVARKGVLSGAQTLASITTGEPDTWTLVPVKTASGSSLQLAVRNVD